MASTSCSSARLRSVISFQRFRSEARQGTYVLHFAYSGEEALAKLDGEIEPHLIVILSRRHRPGMAARHVRRLVTAHPHCGH
jgi:hypothetical protein